MPPPMVPPAGPAAPRRDGVPLLLPPVTARSSSVTETPSLTTITVPASWASMMGFPAPCGRMPVIHSERSMVVLPMQVPRSVSR